MVTFHTKLVFLFVLRSALHSTGWMMVPVTEGSGRGSLMGRPDEDADDDYDDGSSGFEDGGERGSMGGSTAKTDDKIQDSTSALASSETISGHGLDFNFIYIGVIIILTLVILALVTVIVVYRRGNNVKINQVDGREYTEMTLTRNPSNINTNDYVITCETNDDNGDYLTPISLDGREYTEMTLTRNPSNINTNDYVITCETNDDNGDYLTPISPGYVACKDGVMVGETSQNEDYLEMIAEDETDNEIIPALPCRRRTNTAVVVETRYVEAISEPVPEVNKKTSDYDVLSEDEVAVHPKDQGDEEEEDMYQTID